MIRKVLGIFPKWRQSNTFPLAIKSDDSVLQPGDVRDGSSAGISRATPEDQWRRYLGVLLVVTALTSLMAIVVAVLTSRKSASPSGGTGSAANGEVWADEHTGRYFCADSAWYGKTREGRYLSEKEARFTGFRPANGKPCTIAQFTR